MSNPTLRKRIAAPVLMAFLSLMGAAVAAATAADSANARDDLISLGDLG